VIMREVVNGLMYVLSTGCQWLVQSPTSRAFGDLV
jgi:transposase